MSDTPYIFDVTGANFEQLVIENSFHKPVWWTSGPTGAPRARR